VTYSSPIVTFLPLSCGEGIKGRGDFEEGLGVRSMPYISNNYVFLKKFNVGVEKSNLGVEKTNLRGEKINLRVEKTNLRGEKTNVRGEKTNLRGEKTNVRGEKCHVRGEKCNVRGEKCNLTAAIAFLNTKFNHFHIENTKTQPLKSAPLSFWHYV